MNNTEVIIEKTKDLLSGHCYAPLKEAAEKWMAAVGTDGENAAREAFIAGLKEGIMSIDEVIDLFEKDFMIEKFGAEQAKAIHDHAAEAKANGAVWCDCPACTKARTILEMLS